MTVVLLVLITNKTMFKIRYIVHGTLINKIINYNYNNNKRKIGLLEPSQKMYLY